MAEPQLNTIYNEDCLETMKRMPDNFVDLIVTDPPYGLDMGNPKNNKMGKYGKQSNFHKSSDWDKSIPKKEVFDEILRVSKCQILWGANYYVEYLRNARGWIVWDKMNDDFYSTSDGELAWTSLPTRLRFFRRPHGMDKGFMTKLEVGGGNFHPTQKPTKLIKFCITLADKYAEIKTVYDPFMGSGTTARACKDLGRNFIGSEISKEYCDIAEQRLKQEVLL